MAKPFDDIPKPVIDFVRTTFSEANDKVSHTLTSHPAMHEESLDHLLIAELTASPPTFFSQESIAVAIETHWLGGRRMYRRWEIADIALFVIIRRSGRLLVREVALLQTKRLYSREIGLAELDETDYMIGIGRLADRTDRQVPLSHQRAFSFDEDCVYGAMQAGSEQVKNINKYVKKIGIPVFYGFYNPLTLPYAGQYPKTFGPQKVIANDAGCRVLPATAVHDALKTIHVGKAPTYKELKAAQPLDSTDSKSVNGWRLEQFVADEVLRCRQGQIFDDRQDSNLRALLYERTAPIMSAISITVDFGPD